MRRLASDPDEWRVSYDRDTRRRLSAACVLSWCTVLTLYHRSGADLPDRGAGTPGSHLYASYRLRIVREIVHCRRFTLRMSLSPCMPPLCAIPAGHEYRGQPKAYVFVRTSLSVPHHCTCLKLPRKTSPARSTVSAHHCHQPSSRRSLVCRRASSRLARRCRTWRQAHPSRWCPRSSEGSALRRTRATRCTVPPSATTSSAH